jgi:neurofibromin 1
LSLVTAGAFRSNPATQPRLLVALGCLADSEVDDALLYQLSNALRNTLDGQPIKDGNEMILNSLIFACTKLVGARLTPGYSGPESAYLNQLFWLAVAVLEIAEGLTYPLAVTFVETCLRALAMTNLLQRQHLPAFLLRSRKLLEPAAKTLDEIIGINFNRSFSFSMAALLAKGMKSQGSRDIVRSAATVLLELSSKHRIKTSEPANGLESVKPTISFEVLPYLAILIPIINTSEDLASYLSLTGLNGDEYRTLPLALVWKKLFNDGSVEEMLDNETSLLLLSLTAAILASCDREKELLLLYTFFAEAAQNTRSTFPYVYVSCRTVS